MLRRPLSIFLALSLTIGLALEVQAAPDVYVAETSLGLGQQTGALRLPVEGGRTANFWAGFQSISVSPNSTGAPGMSFAALCADSAHYSTSSFLPNYAPLSTNNVENAFTSRATDIQNLFNKWYATAHDSALNAAAFQIALWEVANDDKNLNTGAVQAKPSIGTFQSVVDQANRYLDFSYAGTDLYALTAYKVNRVAYSGSLGQDYIVVSAPGGDSTSPIPEPESYAMLLAGLGLLGLVGKRQKGFRRTIA